MRRPETIQMKPWEFRIDDTKYKLPPDCRIYIIEHINNQDQPCIESMGKYIGFGNDCLPIVECIKCRRNTSVDIDASRKFGLPRSG